MKSSKKILVEVLIKLKIYKYVFDRQTILICNSLGTPIESHNIDFVPILMTMTQQYILLGTKEMIYVWNYQFQFDEKSYKGENEQLFILIEFNDSENVNE